MTAVTISILAMLPKFLDQPNGPISFLSIYHKNKKLKTVTIEVDKAIPGALNSFTSIEFKITFNIIEQIATISGSLEFPRE